MPVTSDEFRRALANFASGVTVVTTVDSAGESFGLTVSAFCSVSLEPPLVLVCIDRSTRCHHAFGESRRYVVNFLSEDQQPLSERFATQLENKFDGVDHHLNPEGLPVLRDAVAVLECRLRNEFDGGDHTIFVAEVERASVNGGKPLLYFGGEYGNMED
jgi:flavin reductase (DIM6/NTAB) family NADH-FMN oxidoreductase RutF